MLPKERNYILHYAAPSNHCKRCPKETCQGRSVTQCARALLKQNIQTLGSRRQTVKETLNIDEQTLNTKLRQAQYTMKDEKPELFLITMEEQLGKIAIELTGSFLIYLMG